MVQQVAAGQPGFINTSPDEAAIRTLESEFAAAFNAGDIGAMMQHYIPGESLVVFDVVPRDNYFGADTYRRNWMDFFSHFKGTPVISVTKLSITVEDTLAFSHSIQQVTGTSIEGTAINRTVRVTDAYRKINGKWLIVHEHISMPVNLSSDRAEPGARH